MSIEPKKDKPAIPEIISLLTEWYSRPGNGVGGIFHVILDDGNFEPCFAKSAVEDSHQLKDPLAIEIAEMLAQMTSTQRRKLNMCWRSYAKAPVELQEQRLRSVAGKRRSVSQDAGVEP